MLWIIDSFCIFVQGKVKEKQDEQKTQFKARLLACRFQERNMPEVFFSFTGSITIVSLEASLAMIHGSYEYYNSDLISCASCV